MKWLLLSLLWIFALLLTVAAAVYQRVTGPTYPITLVVNTGIQKIPIGLLRSQQGKSDCPVILRITDIGVKGVLCYRKYPSHDEMIKVDLKREGDKLVGSLPNQPPAGKLEYRIDLVKNGNPIKVGTGNVVIRFTGDVPRLILYTHIFLMFLAMFFCNIAGLASLFKLRFYKITAVLTFIILVIGGFILGPVVQKYAFNEWWTGIPFGWDLTDNKTLIAVLAWLPAMVMIRKRYARVWILVASVTTIAIFSIPHSLWGSQLNQETGKIIQGHILPFLATFSVKTHQC